MSKHKFYFRSWRNKYILYFNSFVLFFSLLTPANAHMLVKNKESISQHQNRQSQAKPRARIIKRKYGIYWNVIPIKKTTSSTYTGTRVSR